MTEKLKKLDLFERALLKKVLDYPSMKAESDIIKEDQKENE